jgi:hypothetical protein
MRFRLMIAVAAVAAAVLVVFAAPAMSSTGTGLLFHDGAVVGTVLPPASVASGSGLDPFFKVTNGASGQLGIAGVAPGDGPYHGGLWQVWTVTFKAGVTPYVLTSDEAVRAAEAAGDVTLTRVAGSDFRCPVTSTAVAT